MKHYSDAYVYKIYIGLFSLIVITAFTINYFSPTPSSLIVGEWAEKEWKYELIDSYEMVEGYVKNDKVKRLPKSVEKKIREDVLLHQAEDWEFLPNGTLLLHKNDTEVIEAQWRLKGRGHILYIKYQDGNYEYYDIKELNQEELVLNFDIGMEVRGVARLVFKRK
jgi:hypothetical protein